MTTLLGLTMLPMTFQVFAGGAPAGDRIDLPPVKREFSSPTGRFKLVVSSLDGWKTPYAQAELFAVEGPRAESRWRSQLAHHHGPRLVVVSDSGRVAVVDEWINIASRQALTVFDAAGRVVAMHGFDDIAAALGVPRKALAQHGRLGVWLSAAPVLDAAGANVLFKAGGRGLSLSLSDGAMSPTD